ncbi:MAG: hypothetical protein C4B59_02915 [Candidatus Methanogaster sp.]|uniref:Uncharacterized protein n=1 Tax=Candidatus Methanogaster sp. TaxID=3386292 RepID=A0AC61L647_9EURY|nr:MAG: hypothetical protein C4B59_02915 [ANME-2 cluster archaeon]
MSESVEMTYMRRWFGRARVTRPGLGGGEGECQRVVGCVGARRRWLSAGMLAVLLVLACAGAAAGATWVLDDDGGAEYMSIQAAV